MGSKFTVILSHLHVFFEPCDALLGLVRCQLWQNRLRFLLRFSEFEHLPCRRIFQSGPAESVSLNDS